MFGEPVFFFFLVVIVLVRGSAFILKPAQEFKRHVLD